MGSDSKLSVDQRRGGGGTCLVAVPLLHLVLVELLLQQPDLQLELPARALLVVQLRLHPTQLNKYFHIISHNIFAIEVRKFIPDLHSLPDELGELPLDHAAAAQVRVLEHAPVEALVHAVHHGHRLAHHLRVAGLQDLQQRILYLVLMET